MQLEKRLLRPWQYYYDLFDGPVAENRQVLRRAEGAFILKYGSQSHTSNANDEDFFIKELSE